MADVARALIKKGRVTEGEAMLRSLNRSQAPGSSESEQPSARSRPAVSEGTPATPRICFCWGKHDTWVAPVTMPGATPRTPRASADDVWPHPVTPRGGVRESPCNVEVSAPEFSRILQVHLLCGSYVLDEEEKAELEKHQQEAEERRLEEKKRDAERKKEEKRRRLEERQQVVLTLCSVQRSCTLLLLQVKA